MSREATKHRTEVVRKINPVPRPIRVQPPIAQEPLSVEMFFAMVGLYGNKIGQQGVGAYDLYQGCTNAKFTLIMAFWH